MVNNAGIFETTPINRSSYNSYREIMSINLDSAVRASLAAAEHLKKSKGHLLFTSSVLSVKPTEAMAAYCVSKSALSMFSKCMAIELAPDVRVNTISPGPVQTPLFNRVELTPEAVAETMTPACLIGRIGRDDEIAKAIAFIISDEASLMVGHELFFDGGYLLKANSSLSTL